MRLLIFICLYLRRPAPQLFRTIIFHSWTFPNPGFFLKTTHKSTMYNNQPMMPLPQQKFWTPHHTTQWIAILLYIVSLGMSFSKGGGLIAVLGLLISFGFHYWSLSCTIGSSPCYKLSWLYLIIFALPFILAIFVIMRNKSIKDFNPLRTKSTDTIEKQEEITEPNDDENEN